MKKILFITIHLPFPPNKGASVFNTYKIIEYLKPLHQLKIVSLLKGDDASYAEAFLQDLSIDEYDFEPLEVPRSAMNMLKSYVDNTSLNVYRNKSKGLRKRISDIAGQFDIIFVDHYEAFQYVPENYQGKVILRIHNAEHQMWERYASLQQNVMKKIVLALEAKRIKRLEQKYAQRADVVLGPLEDNKHIEPNAGIRKAKFIDFTFLGDEEQLHLPVPQFTRLENAIIYVGTLTWEPNIDGLIWFITNCWQLIQRDVPEVKLYIIGKNPDKRLVDLANKYSNIELTGFVENLEEYFTRCKVNIVPLRFGSGVKVKLINGLYRGIPIVTTPIGIESTLVEHNVHALITDDSYEYANYVTKLFIDSSLWNKLSQKARTLAAESYTWESFYRKLDNVINP